MLQQNQRQTNMFGQSLMSTIDILAENSGSGGGGDDHSLPINISNVTNLQSSLNAKSSTTHNHAADYSALSHNHDSTYAAIAHNHDSDYDQLNATKTISQITNWSTEIQNEFDSRKQGFLVMTQTETKANLEVMSTLTQIQSNYTQDDIQDSGSQFTLSTNTFSLSAGNYILLYECDWQETGTEDINCQFVLKSTTSEIINFEYEFDGNATHTKQFCKQQAFGSTGETYSQYFRLDSGAMTSDTNINFKISIVALSTQVTSVIVPDMSSKLTYTGTPTISNDQDLTNKLYVDESYKNKIENINATSNDCQVICNDGSIDFKTNSTLGNRLQINSSNINTYKPLQLNSSTETNNVITNVSRITANATNYPVADYASYNDYDYIPKIHLPSGGSIDLSTKLTYTTDVTANLTADADIVNKAYVDAQISSGSSSNVYTINGGAEMSSATKYTIIHNLNVDPTLLNIKMLLKMRAGNSQGFTANTYVQFNHFDYNGNTAAASYSTTIHCPDNNTIDIYTPEGTGWGRGSLEGTLDTFSYADAQLVLVVDQISTGANTTNVQTNGIQSDIYYAKEIANGNGDFAIGFNSDQGTYEDVPCMQILKSTGASANREIDFFSDTVQFREHQNTQDVTFKIDPIACQINDSRLELYNGGSETIELDPSSGGEITCASFVTATPSRREYKKYLYVDENKSQQYSIDNIPRLCRYKYNETIREQFNLGAKEHLGYIYEDVNYFRGKIPFQENENKKQIALDKLNVFDIQAQTVDILRFELKRLMKRVEVLENEAKTKDYQNNSQMLLDKKLNNTLDTISLSSQRIKSKAPITTKNISIKKIQL